jgi:hypothetical protein
VRRCGSSPARAVPGEQARGQRRPGKHARAATYAHRGESVTSAGHRVGWEEGGREISGGYSVGAKVAAVRKGGDRFGRQRRQPSGTTPAAPPSSFSFTSCSPSSALRLCTRKFCKTRHAIDSEIPSPGHPAVPDAVKPRPGPGLPDWATATQFSPSQAVTLSFASGCVCVRLSVTRSWVCCPDRHNLQVRCPYRCLTVRQSDMQCVQTFRRAQVDRKTASRTPSCGSHCRTRGRHRSAQDTREVVRTRDDMAHTRPVPRACSVYDGQPSVYRKASSHITRVH